MANYLTLKLKNSTVTIESDDSTVIEKLTDYCKEDLKAYHSTDDYHELTVDTISKEQFTKLNSLFEELGIF